MSFDFDMNNEIDEIGDHFDNIKFSSNKISRNNRINLLIKVSEFNQMTIKDSEL